MPKDYIVLTCAHDGKPEWLMVGNIKRWIPAQAKPGKTWLVQVGDVDGPSEYAETPEQIARLIDEARGGAS